MIMAVVGTTTGEPGDWIDWQGASASLQGIVNQNYAMGGIYGRYPDRAPWVSFSGTGGTATVIDLDPGSYDGNWKYQIYYNNDGASVMNNAIGSYRYFIGGPALQFSK